MRRVRAVQGGRAAEVASPGQRVQAYPEFVSRCNPCCRGRRTTWGTRCIQARAPGSIAQEKNSSCYAQVSNASCFLDWEEAL